MTTDLRALLGYPLNPLPDWQRRPRGTCWWCGSPDAVLIRSRAVQECPTCRDSTPEVDRILRETVDARTYRALSHSYGAGPRYSLRLVVLATALGYRVHPKLTYCTRTFEKPGHRCGHSRCEPMPNLDHAVPLLSLDGSSFAVLSQPYGTSIAAGEYPILTRDAPYGGGTVAQFITSEALS